MPERDINTGIQQLDADLRLLFDLVEKGELARIGVDAQTEPLTPEEFAQLVPEGLVRIGLILNDPFKFQELSTKVRDAKAVLEDARRIVQTKLTDVLNHPLFIQQAVHMLRSAGDEPGPLAKSLHVIHGVSHVSAWLGTPPKLLPTVRIGFYDASKELLLDTSLNWDDLLFLIESLARIAAECMNVGRGLAEQKMLDLEGTGNLASRIKKIEELSAEIRGFAPAYGIDLGSQPASPAGAGSGAAQTGEALSDP